MNRRSMIILLLLVLVAVTGLTIVFIQRQQTTQQHASGLSSTCSNSPTDTVIVIDTSPSMLTDNKLAQAKAAATTFINQLATDTRNKVALVSFSGDAIVLSNMTNQFDAVKSLIGRLTTGNGTCLQCAINKASTVLSATNDNQKRAVVLLTDGQPNMGYSTTSSSYGGYTLPINLPIGYIFPTPIFNSTRVVLLSTQQASDAAMLELKTDFAKNNAAYYTIGLGSDVNTSLLTGMASYTGGQYHFSPDATQLGSIYDSIYKIIGKGSIVGTVFSDVNKNGTYDETGTTPDSGIGGTTLQLTDAQGNSATATSDNSTGKYVFNGLCDASYTLSASSADGWQQTSPTNPSNYSVSISNGSAVSGKNFGFVQGSAVTPTAVPTVTCTPKPTCGPVTTPGSLQCDANQASPPGGWCQESTLTATPTLAGPVCGSSCSSDADCSGAGASCGSCVANTQGDKVCASPLDPSKTSLVVTVAMPGIGTGNGDNAHLIRPTRTGKVTVLDSQNNQVSSDNVQFVYNNGSFVGTDSITADTGYYTVKVQLDNTLVKQIPGVQHLQKGTLNSLPAVNLIPGDLNGNNVMDLSDYQVFVSCYGTASCTQKTQADFNDDGTVDVVDYNILLRSFSVHNGD